MNNNLTSGKRSTSKRLWQQAGTPTALVRRILQTGHLLPDSVDTSEAVVAQDFVRDLSRQNHFRARHHS